MISFNVLVLTLGFHTYLAHVVSKAKNEPLKVVNLIKVRPVKGIKEADQFIDMIIMDRAIWMNTIAKVTFAVFNLYFVVEIASLKCEP